MTAPIGVRVAVGAEELAACRALRVAVFCGEQGLFHGTDGDAVDTLAVTVGAFVGVGDCERLIGTVRVHCPTPDEWEGSRLAVLRAYRSTAHVGTQLIRFAVCYAHAKGARRFRAHVQERNAAMFHALHWRTIEETLLHGAPHHLMQADLAHYPAASLAHFETPLCRAA